MLIYYKRIRQILRYSDWHIGRYLDATASICRHSKLNFPCLVGPGARIKRSLIGRYTYVARGTRILNSELGSYCSIGPECLIGGLGKHPANHFSTSPITYSPRHSLGHVLGNTGYDLNYQEEAPVSIGSDVWIGARSIVLDGITIGHGAIIGANTVVTKNVPPYAVVYGSPPQIRRYRFTPIIIEKILLSEWWENPVDQLDTSELLQLIGQNP